MRKLPPTFCKLFSFLILAASAALSQKSSIVTTVAGAHLGNHKPALSADFAYLPSVAVDAGGNIYVSDSGHCQVRRIDKNGAITRFAGSDICGFGGDGGPATFALLSDIFGIAFDNAGSLVIADFGNDRIRKVSTDGIISTVAGDGIFGYSGDEGPATQASLLGPQGVSADRLGNIYIADTDNFVIRKVDSSGIIHTVAGTNVFGIDNTGDGGPATSAPIGLPQSVVADDKGNFYIADSTSFVRRVDSAGIITTFAGNGQFPFSGNTGSGGPATSASIGQALGLLISNGNLYISTQTYIWAVDLSTQIANIVGGNGSQGFGGDGQPALSAAFNNPFGLAASAVGDLLIADSWNARLREISSSTQIVRTIAGGFLGDGRRSDDSGLDVQFGGGLRFDGQGNLYVADTQNNRIRKVSTKGVITTFAGTGISGLLGDAGPATAADLSAPTAVAIDGSGNVFIADSGNGVIRKVDITGTITTFARPGFGLFSLFPDLAFDNNGNLYASDGLFAVWKIDLFGDVTLFAGTVFGVGSTADGIPATEAQLGAPSGLAVDSQNNVYITEFFNNRVRKVDGNGIISTVAGTGAFGFNGDGIQATTAELSQPTDIALDGKGNLYIADWTNFRVRVVDNSGVIHTFAGSGSPGFNGDRMSVTQTNIEPISVAISPGGLIYFTDQQSFRVRRVEPR